MVVVVVVNLGGVDGRTIFLGPVAIIFGSDIGSELGRGGLACALNRFVRPNLLEKKNI